MDFQLNDEQQQLRKSVREFAEREIAPHVLEWDEASRFPMETVKELGKMGLLGVIFPSEYGGAGMSYDLDEKETIFGQDLTARYHATDTWMRRNGQWQIVAGQVLRYYEDPALGKIDPRKFKAYVGTYQLAPGNTLVISADGSQLFRQRGDRAKETLLPESSDIFFRKGIEGRILFRLGENGKIDALIDRRNNEDVVWKKVA